MEEKEDLKKYTAWESDTVFVQVFFHGEKTYRLDMYAINDGKVMFPACSYLDEKKFLKIIEKFNLKPTTHKLRLWSPNNE